MKQVMASSETFWKSTVLFCRVWRLITLLCWSVS